mgnify:CR=1 FL=1
MIRRPWHQRCPAQQLNSQRSIQWPVPRVATKGRCIEGQAITQGTADRSALGHRPAAHRQFLALSETLQ